MTIIRFDRKLLGVPQQFETFLTKEAKKTELDSINECVMRLSFKKKFVFIKGKTAIGALKCVFRALNDYNGEKSKNLPDDNLYLHFVRYFWQEKRGWTFKIKVISATNNAAELLKTEQKMLWKYKDNPDCLNNTFDSYIPIYREEIGTHGWINRGFVLTFLKWRKKNEKK